MSCVSGLMLGLEPCKHVCDVKFNFDVVLMEEIPQKPKTMDCRKVFEDALDLE